MRREMGLTSVVRWSLRASCPFNLGAAALLAFPNSDMGRALGLPPAVPTPYAALLVFLISLFGFTYLWMSFRTIIDRPLLGVAIVGKAGAFVIAVVLLTVGELSGRLVLFTSIDAAFAILWLVWLVRSRRDGLEERTPGGP